MHPVITTTFCLMLCFVVGCQEEPSQTVKVPPQVAQNGTVGKRSITSVAGRGTEALGQPGVKPAQETVRPGQEPPCPPVFENFQGLPQLKLFPWVGRYRPADDSGQLASWQAAIDQLISNTGIAEDRMTGSRSWVFESIESNDSFGYFAPLGVDPETEYRLAFEIDTALPEGASAGISIFEFDRFLWVSGQYGETIFKQHFRGSHEGLNLAGGSKGKYSFSFVTGPETGMIHIVLFCSGGHTGGKLLFDDIAVEKTSGGR